MLCDKSQDNNHCDNFVDGGIDVPFVYGGLNKFVVVVVAVVAVIPVIVVVIVVVVVAAKWL